MKKIALLTSTFVLLGFLFGCQNNEGNNNNGNTYNANENNNKPKPQQQTCRSCGRAQQTKKS